MEIAEISTKLGGCSLKWISYSFMTFVPSEEVGEVSLGLLKELLS